MSRWHAFKKADANEFGIALRIDEGEGVTAAGLSTYPEIMAMRSHLNEERIGSPPIASNVNLPASWSQPDTLGFRNLGTLGSLFFNVTGLTQHAHTGSYTLFQLDCEQDPESSLNVTDAISALEQLVLEPQDRGHHGRGDRRDADRQADRRPVRFKTARRGVYLLCRQRRSYDATCW